MTYENIIKIIIIHKQKGYHSFFSDIFKLNRSKPETLDYHLTEFVGAPEPNTQLVAEVFKC